jgi:2-polyprenyl-3-methyl-5-hydroxy-6-metoxy-1,4-benzoquinol methylase
LKQKYFSEKYAGKCWDENAETWAKLVQAKQDTYREALNNPEFKKFVGEVDNKKILDLGCGEGYNTRIFAKQGAKMTGIDISSQMIAHAVSHEKNKPLGIDYQITSFSDLSIFKSNSFDTIISTMALMDSPDYDNAMKESFRVLKNNGKIFFSILHPCFMTKGFGWIKDASGESKILTVSDYFTDASWEEAWTFSKGQIPDNSKPFNVPCFPRTISEYVNVLINSGLMITKIHEPRPSVASCKKYSWLKRWREHAAIFLYIAAEKKVGRVSLKRTNKTRE